MKIITLFLMLIVYFVNINIYGGLMFDLFCVSLGWHCKTLKQPCSNAVIINFEIFFSFKVYIEISFFNSTNFILHKNLISLLTNKIFFLWLSFSR